VARGKLVLPVDDDLAEMYVFARSRLAQAGYEQYEISNWAKPGRASRHNLTYWRDEQWIGVGAGAASSYDGRRWKNSPVLERYIESIERDGRATCVEDEQPDRVQSMLDYVTLGLRLREGISLAGFRGRFDVDLRNTLGETGSWLIEMGFLELNAERLRVAAEHQLITNEILVRLEEPLRDANQVRRETSASQIAVR
jgi:oxygen-independent coproporphyrinogen-3 oxidase